MASIPDSRPSEQATDPHRAQPTPGPREAQTREEVAHLRRVNADLLAALALAAESIERDPKMANRFVKGRDRTWGELSARIRVVIAEATGEDR